MAHELGHVKQRDLARGMLWVAIVAPGGMLRRDAAHPALERACRDVARARAASLPAFALALALVAFGLDVVSNQLSRAVEADADAYSLELTGEAREFIELERRLALREPDAIPTPRPRTSSCSRPTRPTVERIGVALAFERRR